MVRQWNLSSVLGALLPSILFNRLQIKRTLDFVNTGKSLHARLTPYLGTEFTLSVEKEGDAMPKTQKLTISRLARLGGVNLETVRYYERRGLLPKPPRTQAGYRQFSPEAAQRLRFIKRAQELGFSLDEIRELLALRVEPRQNRADIRARMHSKIADIEQKMKTLAAMKIVLCGLVERCEHCLSDECPILASLNDESSI
jgi:MerR family mercuric resistance operon transcriptional regulator